MVTGDAPNDSSGDVIVLDEVEKRFGDFVAVERAHFGIARGEFFSMLGPSGCGKTTTLRMIAGFESPSSGHILLDGEDVSQTPPYKRNVNTVFQQYALFPHMTVQNNIAFGLKARRVGSDEIAQRVAEMLETVRMTEFAARKPAQLSGGQQQRVALARALVNRPAALLLDEPLAALDLKLRQAMQLELKRIQRDTKVTFVFVTHDQEEALTMSDRIAVMSAGRVEQIGTPAEIYHRPASEFVAGFIGEANMLPASTVGVSAGSSSVYMVRPERVTVSHAALDGHTSIPATVTELIFRGANTRVEMATASGDPLVAHVVDGNDIDALRPGAPAFANWSPDAGYLVPSTHPTL